MPTSLQRLTLVPVREVWPHEAHDFTPWLLMNVDVLSDLLGMELALTVAEHPVGGFSLDLLGRDESTGQTVIVENQLETSDHTHLGQILTYAAGTDPSTIVWITTGFVPSTGPRSNGSTNTLMRTPASSECRSRSCGSGTPRRPPRSS